MPQSRSGSWSLLGQHSCGSPHGFLPAAAFQWVNPKAWVAILGALAAYAPITDTYAQSVALMVGLFTAITIPSAGTCVA